MKLEKYKVTHFSQCDHEMTACYVTSFTRVYESVFVLPWKLLVADSTKRKWLMENASTTLFSVFQQKSNTWTTCCHLLLLLVSQSCTFLNIHSSMGLKSVHLNSFQIGCCLTINRIKADIKLQHFHGIEMSVLRSVWSSLHSYCCYKECQKQEVIYPLLLVIYFY